MTDAPTDYPSAWTPRGAPQEAAPPAPIEALMLALDAYVAALDPAGFEQLVARTRGPR